MQVIETCLNANGCRASSSSLRSPAPSSPGCSLLLHPVADPRSTLPATRFFHQNTCIDTLQWVVHASGCRPHKPSRPSVYIDNRIAHRHPFPNVTTRELSSSRVLTMNPGTSRVCLRTDVAYRIPQRPPVRDASLGRVVYNMRPATLQGVPWEAPTRGRHVHASNVTAQCFLAR